MTRRKRRFYLLTGSGLVAAIAVTLLLSAIGTQANMFYTPKEIAERKVPMGQRINLGGLVEPGSVVKDGAKVRFVVTDGTAKATVHYVGILPDLFRDGQGVVTTGAFTEPGAFKATQVLAKHDENYMPPEVAKALKAQGRWKDGVPPAD